MDQYCEHHFTPPYDPKDKTWYDCPDSAFAFQFSAVLPKQRADPDVQHPARLSIKTKDG